MDESEAKKKSIKKKILYGCIAFLIILASLYSYYRYSLKAEIARIQDEIRAAGYPVTGEELNAWYSIPEGVENAADVYAKAFALFVVDDEIEKHLPFFNREFQHPPLGDSYSEETLLIADEYLEINANALQWIYSASELKHCRYPIDFRKGYDIRVPHLANLRRAAMLLNLEAIIHSEHNRPDMAVRSILTMLAIAHSLDNEPHLLSTLVRINIIFITLNACEYLFNTQDLTDEKYRILEKAIVHCFINEIFSRAIAGEILSIEARIDAINHDLKQNSFTASSTTGTYWEKTTGAFDKAHAKSLQRMVDLRIAASAPMHQRLQRIIMVDNKTTSSQHPSQWTHFLSPSIMTATKTDVGIFAHMQITITTCAIERYRLKHNTLPEILDDLAPQYLERVPGDPFNNNEPLHYKKQDTGYTLYSIGEDGVDDNGSTITRTTLFEPYKTYDIAVRIKR